jgi:hypothetical protein
MSALKAVNAVRRAERLQRDAERLESEALDAPDRLGCFDPAPEGEGVALLDLAFAHCRWPRGERYCGEPRLLPGSYCARHALIAVAPTPRLTAPRREPGLRLATGAHGDWR